MKRNVKAFAEIAIILMIFISFAFTGCYSVFNGGTGGVVVDAESSSVPKAGIPEVDVYVYTSQRDRNSDFSKWKEGSEFKPSASYYGHTKTAADGSFSVSNIIWKAYLPSFGKDADVQKIYLLFYHKNYGLTKGGSLVVSDTYSDSVVQELTSIRKTMPLTININDVKDGSRSDVNMAVEISVPQTNGKIKNVPDAVYKTNIAGTGTVSVSYPRYFYDASGNKTENTPEIAIKYYQAAEEVTWKACFNADNEAQDYSFRNMEEAPVTKILPVYERYEINLYGKPCKISVPELSGQWGTADGVVLKLFRSKDNGATYTEECGAPVTTYSMTLGTSGTEKHGVFGSLGNGSKWIDESYTDKIAEAKFRITDGSEHFDLVLRSDEKNRTVQK